MTIQINTEGREPIRTTRVAKYYSIPVYLPYFDINTRSAYKYKMRLQELDPSFNPDSYLRPPFIVVNLEFSSKLRMAGIKEFKNDYRKGYYQVPNGWFLDKQYLTFHGKEFYLRKEDCIIVPDIEGETGIPPAYITKRKCEGNSWRQYYGYY